MHGWVLSYACTYWLAIRYVLAGQLMHQPEVTVQTVALPPRRQLIFLLYETLLWNLQRFNTFRTSCAYQVCMELAINSTVAWLGAWQTEHDHDSMKVARGLKSSVNFTSSKTIGFISPLQFTQFCCHSFKTHVAVQWTRLMRTGFQPDQWAPDPSCSCTSTRAGTTKQEGTSGWQGERLSSIREVLHQLQPTLKHHHQPHVLRKSG